MYWINEEAKWSTIIHWPTANMQLTAQIEEKLL